ncbi:MAG: 50S ribosomal protein L9 [Alphaproteobacteria bacterium]|nr:MAG: 50S ribosomal protein L9 [Rickettsiaceae bacterium 4572_127]
MQIILMENIGKLGKAGDLVEVKPGYARNFLFPMKKALRANKANKTIFEEQKVDIEKKNIELEKSSESLLKKLKGLDFIIARKAGETGRLYGSVSARNVAEEINKKFNSNLTSHSIQLVAPLKEIGIFPVSTALYGDLKTDFRIIIAQTEAEAKDLIKEEKEEKIKEKSREEEETKKLAEAKKAKLKKAEENDSEDAESKVDSEIDAETEKKEEVKNETEIKKS